MFLIKLLCGKPDHRDVWILEVSIESILLWVFFLNWQKFPALRGDYLYTIALRSHHPSMQPFHCHLLNSWASVLCYPHSTALIGFATDTRLMLLQRRGRQILPHTSRKIICFYHFSKKQDLGKKNLLVTEGECPRHQSGQALVCWSECPPISGHWASCLSCGIQSPAQENLWMESPYKTQRD